MVDEGKGGLSPAVGAGMTARARRVREQTGRAGGGPVLCQ